MRDGGRLSSCLLSASVIMLVALVVLGLGLASPANSFNLDTENAVVYQGDPDSLFGFSVAAHRDQQTGW